MNVKYFNDTDTALLEFSNAEVDETREITANVYIDLDKDGNLVGMTIEHAATTAQFPHIRIERIDASAAEPAWPNGADFAAEFLAGLLAQRTPT